MIYEMSRDIESALSSRGYPLKVYYDRAGHSECWDSRIVFARDRKTADTFGPPRGNKSNPRRKMERGLATVVTVYARSSLDGAGVGDHERECEKYVDALAVLIAEWVAREVHGRVEFQGSYVDPDDPDDLKKWGGVVYELRFSVPRGVHALTYTGEGSPGEGRPTQSLGGIRNQTQARYAQTDSETTEIGCGRED